MRLIYSLIFYLALPFIFLRLLWRARKNSAYKARWIERLGYMPTPIPEKVLWWHSVSMGETLASIPLIKLIQARFPNLPILVTTTTPTGSEQVKTKLGNSVYHMYMPYDLPNIMSQFIKKINPRLLVIMETELWPNMLHYCHQLNIPVLLANARLSQKSKNGYARFPKLTQEMLNNLSCIAVQNQEDGQRFLDLGLLPEKLSVTGSVKFDINISEDILIKAKNLRCPKLTWIAASTHQGEEEIIFNAYKKLSDTLLILAPRHMDRTQEVLNLCQKYNLSVCRRSKDELPTENTDVFLIDTMGELLLFYACSDVAFVGGSLIPRGGHNLLEPAALGLPVLSGESLYNFAQIEKLLDNAHALIKIKTAEDLGNQIEQLKNNPEKRKILGDAAKSVVMANKGATDKHMNLIEKFLHAK